MAEIGNNFIKVAIFSGIVGALFHVLIARYAARRKENAQQSIVRFFLGQEEQEIRATVSWILVLKMVVSIFICILVVYLDLPKQPLILSTIVTVIAVIEMIISLRIPQFGHRAKVLIVVIGSIGPVLFWGASAIQGQIDIIGAFVSIFITMTYLPFFYLMHLAAHGRR